jgi:lipoyl-dependent peroxiredoxin
MPIARREAEIVWEGPLATGTGTVRSASGALGELPVTWASRTDRADGKASPEELIAAAHTSCFAMALSLVLGENKTPPERVIVNAACILDEVEAHRESRRSSSPCAHRRRGSRPASSSA